MNESRVPTTLSTGDGVRVEYDSAYAASGVLSVLKGTVTELTDGQLFFKGRDGRLLQVSRAGFVFSLETAQGKDQSRRIGSRASIQHTQL